MTNIKRQKIQWQIPREHRAVLLVPDFSRCCQDAQENVALRTGWSFFIGEWKIDHFVKRARKEFLCAAYSWTRSFRPCEDVDVNQCDLIILTGHQPELFHPGVWLKNFVAARLAKAVGGLAVNILIDNDRPKRLWVPVLGGSPNEPGLVCLEIDGGSTAAPLEMRQIENREIFASFGERAQRYLCAWVNDPLLTRYWPKVLRLSASDSRLGYVLAQARNQCEAEWGVELLDVPLSVIADLPSHCEFLGFVLLELPRVWQAYNESLEEYRAFRGWKNKAQPVPNLQAHDGWFEVPYWVWSDELPSRRRLFAGRRGTTIVLADLQGWEAQLECSAQALLSQLATQLNFLRQRGIRFRPRALMTTLFVRLILGDYFVHGIGGAQYDQVTDVIIQRLFQVEPPKFAVASGTLFLARPECHDCEERIRKIKHQLRELKFHPEKFFLNKSQESNSAQLMRLMDEKWSIHEIEPLIQQKLFWIHTTKTPENARTRHYAITKANERLYKFLQDLEQQLLTELYDLQEKHRRDKILRFREFPFCFFEEKTLRDFFDQTACLPSTRVV